MCKIYINFLCSLPKPLRKALKEVMSSSEHLQESLPTSLCTALQHGLGALRDPPTKERAAALSDGLFNNISIPLVSQVNFLMIGIQRPLSSKFLFTC